MPQSIWEVEKKKVVAQMLLKKQQPFKGITDISDYSRLSEGYKGCDMAK